MQILLFILKILGITVLGILGLALFLLLIVLFWPVGYQAKASYHGQPYVRVDVGWLFRMLHLKVVYENGELTKKLTLLGFSLKKREKKQKKVKRDRKAESRKNRKAGQTKSPPADDVRLKNRIQHPEHQELKNRQSDNSEPKNRQPEYQESRNWQSDDQELQNRQSEKVPPKNQSEENVISEDVLADMIQSQDDEKPILQPEVKDFDKDRQKPEAKTSSGRKVSKVRQIADKVKQVVEKIKVFVKKLPSIRKQLKNKIKNIKEKIVKLKNKIRRFYEFLTLEENKTSFGYIWKLFKKMVKHVSPRKVKGYVRFGMEDPCTTGEILGAVAIFYGKYGKNIRVIPEFEEKCLEAELKLRGHMQLGVLGIHALRVLFSSEFRSLKHNFDQLKEDS